MLRGHANDYEELPEVCLGSSGLHPALVEKLASQKDLVLPPGDRD